MAQNPFGMINNPPPTLSWRLNEQTQTYYGLDSTIGPYLSFDCFLYSGRNIFHFSFGENRNFFLALFCWNLCLLLFLCLSLCRSIRSGIGGSNGTRLTLLAFLLHYLRIASLGHVPEYDFRNLEHTFEFRHGLRSQNHINENIQSVAVALDGVCQAATPPLIDLHNLSAICGDNLFDTL